MYSELIKKLRETPSIPVDAKLHNEAADAIEELLASCDNFEAALKDSVEECEKLQGQTQLLEKLADYWCNKVPKLPHGDLIDRDALMKKLNNCMFPSDMVTTRAVSMAINWLKESPTIIESECKNVSN